MPRAIMPVGKPFFPEIDDLALFRVSFLIGFLNQSPLSLISPFPCRFDFQNVFQPVLFLQTFMNLEPGTQECLCSLHIYLLGRFLRRAR